MNLMAENLTLFTFISYVMLRIVTMVVLLWYCYESTPYKIVTAPSDTYTSDMVTDVYLLYILPESVFTLGIYLLFYVQIKALYISFDHSFKYDNWSYYLTLYMGLGAMLLLIFIVSSTVYVMELQDSVTVGSLYTGTTDMVLIAILASIWLFCRYYVFKNSMLKVYFDFKEVKRVLYTFIYARVVVYVVYMVYNYIVIEAYGQEIDSQYRNVIMSSLPNPDDDILVAILNYGLLFAFHVIYAVYPINEILSKEMLKSIEKHDKLRNKYGIETLIDLDIYEHDQIDKKLNIINTSVDHTNNTSHNSLKEKDSIKINNSEYNGKDTNSKNINNSNDNLENANESKSNSISFRLSYMKNLGLFELLTQYNFKDKIGFGIISKILLNNEQLILRSIEMEDEESTKDKFSKDVFAIKKYGELLFLNNFVVPKYVSLKDSEYYIMFEYLNLQNFKEYSKNLNLKTKLKYFYKLVDGVNNVNKKGLFLTNLNLENIHYKNNGSQKDGAIFVTGCGFSNLKALYALSYDYSEAWQFQAPEILVHYNEVAEFPDTVHSKADTYSLGMILYAIVAGKLLVDKETAIVGGQSLDSGEECGIYKEEILQALDNGVYGLKIELNLDNKDLKQRLESIIRACTDFREAERPYVSQLKYLLDELFVQYKNKKFY